mmetsp:Transcript_18288/g.21867  ORF Transcript_18288/g.21867 Transcript_18288/m.21867 type:complete len:322 (+) Transcript_18288:118-1083(+)
MSYASRGSGGGGGFGGFPYRSAHQQGSDGRGNANRRKNNRDRHERRKERGGALICEVSLKVPVNRRRIIIGQNGTTIRWLTERTRTVINVPGIKNVNPNACVKIRGSCITHVLHACWELSCLLLPLSGDDRDCDRTCDADDVCQDESHIEYKLVIQGSDSVFKGKLKRNKRCVIDQVADTSCTTNTDRNDKKLTCEKTSGAFMVGTEEENGSDHKGTGGISAFCIPTQLSQENISVLVDNERFIDPNIIAKFEVISVNAKAIVSKDDDSGEEQSKHEEKGNDNVKHGTSESALIFIYGSEQEKPYHLFSVLMRKTIECENS